MSKKPRSAVTDRNRQIARIHMGKATLGLDDETYRALLVRVTGVASSADMTPDQRNAVIAELVRLGFKAEDPDRQRKQARRPKGLRSRPMLRKVEALLASSERPWQYAHSLAQRMFKTERVEWLPDNQLHKLVSALQVDADRRRK